MSNFSEAFCGQHDQINCDSLWDNVTVPTQQVTGPLRTAVTATNSSFSSFHEGNTCWASHIHIFEDIISIYSKQPMPSTQLECNITSHPNFECCSSQLFDISHWLVTNITGSSRQQLSYKMSPEMETTQHGSLSWKGLYSDCVRRAWNTHN